jgi:hypothetical protein
MVSIIQKGNGLEEVFQEEVKENFRVFLLGVQFSQNSFRITT